MTHDEMPVIPETVAATGKAYWRSLDELADTPEFRDWVERRFPQSMRELLDGVVDRRRFLHLMAASLGLAGLAGCRRPESFALPYTKPPDEVSPGLPTFYATAMPRPGAAVALLVESHEGRPTKVEGNPKHPDSQGTSDLIAQASVLDLYDPDRSREVLLKGHSSSWAAFEVFTTEHFTALRARKGEGLHVLVGDVVSPALELLRAHLQTVMPSARWYVHEPIGRESVEGGTGLAFGEPLRPRYHLDQALVVLALDADILGQENDGGRHVGDFARSRQVSSAGATMSRLYAVESRFSITGGKADHRLRLASSHVAEYTLALARELILTDPASSPLLAGPRAALRAALEGFKPSVSFERRWVREVAADFRAHPGKSLVIAGRNQPPLVHALAHALNAALGNVGKTVEYRAAETSGTGSLKELAGAVVQGKVSTLAVLGVNPAYDAPVDLDFASLLKQVATTIHLGSHVDETARLVTWHLPAAHYLESWGDARTGDGTLVPVQPLIEPLFGGRTALEVVARLSGFEVTAPYEIVRRSFRKVCGVVEASFEPAWRRFLHDGLLAGSARPLVKPAPRWDAVAKAIPAHTPATPLSAGDLELVFGGDAKVDDGRFANNGWLQEIPDPVTKLTWDNAALISPKTARELGVGSGDVVRLELGGRNLEIVAFVLPGQADSSVAVALGYGRTAAGRVGSGVGFNTYTIRSTATPHIAVGLKVTRTGRSYPLASTQNHSSMEGRDLVRETSLTALKGQPAAHAHPHEEEAGDIQVRPAFEGEHQWGMVIDLNSCVGCNACTVACQSENNIPIVGKTQVIVGREMHWIRIDRYFWGDESDPGLVHQPVACMQCESAPCEVVCPVNATVHSDDGLNLMVYNRCIGTRYCENNCPYKTRRFNYFNYNERPLNQLTLGPLAEKGMPETLKMQKNPDVSVRIRGVMEKCNYCTQRIDRAKIGAKVEAGLSGHTAIPDGTIVPACAQACPARAIVFGDLSDPNSRVSRVKRENASRDYALLGELNTRPRTTYLASVRNPNPKMPTAGPAGEEGHA